MYRHSSPTKTFDGVPHTQCRMFQPWLQGKRFLFPHFCLHLLMCHGQQDKPWGQINVFCPSLEICIKYTSIVISNSISWFNTCVRSFLTSFPYYVIFSQLLKDELVPNNNEHRYRQQPHTLLCSIDLKQNIKSCHPLDCSGNHLSSCTCVVICLFLCWLTLKFMSYDLSPACPHRCCNAYGDSLSVPTRYLPHYCAELVLVRCILSSWVIHTAESFWEFLGCCGTNSSNSSFFLLKQVPP